MKKLAVMMVAGLAAIQVFGGVFQSKQVSDSARWVVHADLDLLKQTQVGGFVMEQLNSGAMSDKVAAMAAILQFDPRKDLNAVTLYGKSKNPDEGIALFTGKFNENQLVTLLKANESYQATLHGGTSIHSWIDAKKPGQGRQYAAAHSGKILIGKGLPMLQEALDVLDGKHASINPAETFGSDLPVRDPFFVAGSDIPGMGGQGDAQILNQTKSGRMALGEKDGMMNLAVSLVAADETVASQLHSIAQGLLAMGQMRQEKDPRLAELLKTVTISLEGTQVKLDMACPSEQIIAMLQQMVNKSKPAPAPAPAP